MTVPSSVNVDALTSPQPAVTPPMPALSWSDGSLYKHGAPHRMLSGSMQYFRVHPEHWEDRLRRLVALGVNTVDTYVAWNFHERSEGEFDFNEWRDIERYITLAGELGLDVFLRPSPYICAEWSNGGLPHWLTGRARALRSVDPSYIAAVDAWWDELIPRIVPLQAAYGGPIVAVQVENEYGSYGTDTGHLAYLRDGLRARGVTELLTTADGITGDMQRYGSVDGAMPTFTFGSGVARARAEQRSDVPFLCSEMWGGWFDHWGENHHVRSAESMMGTINEILEIGGSFSLYMAHGGTNFGYWNGANHDIVLQPTVTSYDYNAPIGEDGTLNEKFYALRATLQQFHEQPLPAPPANPRLQRAATAPLHAISTVTDHIERTAVHTSGVTPLPLTFEELGAEDGYVVYESTIGYAASSVLIIDGLHDRATVRLNGETLGVLERDGATEIALPGEAASATLQLIVESLGRINYGPFTGEGKGIMRAVRIGRRIVHGWTHRVLGDLQPTTSLFDAAASGASEASRMTHPSPDTGVAKANLSVAEPLDAWLAFPGGVKGSVWLNGFLLGRYWEVGPTHTLYAPAPLWRVGDNEVVVFDAEGLPTRVEIREAPEFGPDEEFIGV